MPDDADGPARQRAAAPALGAEQPRQVLPGRDDVGVEVDVLQAAKPESTPPVPIFRFREEVNVAPAPTGCRPDDGGVAEGGVGRGPETEETDRRFRRILRRAGRTVAGRSADNGTCPSSFNVSPTSGPHG